MELPELAFTVIDWEAVPPSRHAGEVGTAAWRTFETGSARVRLVEYPSGYVADHWCERGHILLVLEGELITDLKDGRHFVLTPGMSYMVSDEGDAPHRSSSTTGVRLFIVD